MVRRLRRICPDPQPAVFRRDNQAVHNCRFRLFKIRQLKDSLRDSFVFAFRQGLCIGCGKNPCQCTKKKLRVVPRVRQVVIQHAVAYVDFRFYHAHAAFTFWFSMYLSRSARSKRIRAPKRMCGTDRDHARFRTHQIVVERHCAADFTVNKRASAGDSGLEWDTGFLLFPDIVDLIKWNPRSRFNEVHRDLLAWFRRPYR